MARFARTIAAHAARCTIILAAATLALLVATAAARADGGTPPAYPHGDASPAVAIADTAPSGHYTRLGDCMAVSGDTAIVGETMGNALVGGAQIFVRSDHGWAHQAGLSDLSDPNAPGLGFGSAVAIDGDTAVVADCGASITCFPMDPPTAVYGRFTHAWARNGLSRRS